MREQQGIKQTELAAYLNVGQNTYSQYENCQRQTPVAVLIKLADYFGVSVDYLIGRKGASAAFFVLVAF